VGEGTDVPTSFDLKCAQTCIMETKACLRFFAVGNSSFMSSAL